MPITLWAILSLILAAAPAEADELYVGAGLHAFNSDNERDGSLTATLRRGDPRIYVGWRLHENVAIEAEAGRHRSNSKLWSNALNADFRIRYLAVNAVGYLPVEWLLQPYAYAGAGRAFWQYDIGAASDEGRASCSDSSSDTY